MLSVGGGEWVSSFWTEEGGSQENPSVRGARSPNIDHKGKYGGEERDETLYRYSSNEVP